MAVPVYCGAGMSSNPRMRDDHLAGQLFKGSYKRVDVTYPNRVVTLANVDVFVNKIAGICQQPGRKIVFGHSAGARGICRYLRTNPDIDEDDNVFVLTGNQERKYGGANVLGYLPAADYGGTGIPEDTPFRVFDVARQYAFPEDCPNRRDPKAIANITAELNPIKFRPAFHSDYSRTLINDPSNAVHVEGRIAYILSPSPLMPQVFKYWTPQRRQLEDAKLRPVVEAAYDRPFASVPTPRTASGATIGTGPVVLPSVPEWNPWA